MAEFNVDYSSMDSLISSLSKLDLFDDEMQEKLLGAGASSLMDAITEEAARAPYDLKFLSGRLRKSRKVKKGKDGTNYIEVFVSGKNSDKQQYTTIAFVLNYGRSKRFGEIPGSFFWTRAVRRTQKTVFEDYEDVVTETLKERKLI